MEDGEEKQVLVVKLANLMKRHFLTWNRNTVEDSVIAAELSEVWRDVGVARGVELRQADILRNVRKTSDVGTSPQEEKEAPLSRGERRSTFPESGLITRRGARMRVGRPRNSGAWEVSSLRAARGCKESFPRVQRTRRCRFCARDAHPRARDHPQFA